MMTIRLGSIDENSVYTVVLSYYDNYGALAITKRERSDKKSTW